MVKKIGKWWCVCIHIGFALLRSPNRQHQAINLWFIAKKERLGGSAVHSQLNSPAGHYQPFKHPYMTRSPPIAKLSEVFMNKHLKTVTQYFSERWGITSVTNPKINCFLFQKSLLVKQKNVMLVSIVHG